MFSINKALVLFLALVAPPLSSSSAIDIDEKLQRLEAEVADLKKNLLKAANTRRIKSAAKAEDGYICYSDGDNVYSASAVDDDSDASDATAAVINLGKVTVSDGEAIIVEATMTDAALINNDLDDYDLWHDSHISIIARALLIDSNGNRFAPEPDRALPIKVRSEYLVMADYGLDYLHLLEMDTTTVKFYFHNLPKSSKNVTYDLYFEILLLSSVESNLNRVEAGIELGPYLIQVSNIKDNSEACRVDVVNDDNLIYSQIDDDNFAARNVADAYEDVNEFFN